MIFRKTTKYHRERNAVHKKSGLGLPPDAKFLHPRPQSIGVNS